MSCGEASGHQSLGDEVANRYSPRYIIRLQQMVNRLQHTPFGKEKAMLALQAEIQASLQRLDD